MRGQRVRRPRLVIEQRAIDLWPPAERVARTEVARVGHGAIAADQRLAEDFAFDVGKHALDPDRPHDLVGVEERRHADHARCDGAAASGVIGAGLIVDHERAAEALIRVLAGLAPRHVAEQALQRRLEVLRLHADPEACDVGAGEIERRCGRRGAAGGYRRPGSCRDRHRLHGGREHDAALPVEQARAQQLGPHHARTGHRSRRVTLADDPEVDLVDHAATDAVQLRVELPCGFLWHRDRARAFGIGERDLVLLAERLHRYEVAGREQRDAELAAVMVVLRDAAVDADRELARRVRPIERLLQTRCFGLDRIGPVEVRRAPHRVAALCDRVEVERLGSQLVIDERGLLGIESV